MENATVTQNESQEFNDPLYTSSFGSEQGTVLDASESQTSRNPGLSFFLGESAGTSTVTASDQSGTVIQSQAANESVDLNGGDFTFVYEAGDGNDVIESSIYVQDLNDNDVLQFQGLLISDVRFERVEDTLVSQDADSLQITVIQTGETVLIRNYFLEEAAAFFKPYVGIQDPAEFQSTYQNVEQIVFEDGTTLEYSDVVRLIEQSEVTLYGTAADDTLDGSSEADVMDGLAGNDTLRGYAGNDTLYGAEGNDRLIGNGGQDALFGGGGNDVLNGGGAADYMEGGLGNDTYVLNTAADQVVEQQGEGTDTVRITGSLTDYSLADNVERLFISQDAGVDVTVSGNSLSNTIFSAQSNDSIDGLDGVDTVSYVRATDSVTVDLSVTGAQDTGFGVDTLINIENLIGSRYSDTLTGDANRNVIRGNDGDDVLNGGYERDVLIGGAGQDTFVFSSELISSQADRIRDFELGDVIALDQDIFTQLDLGALSADNFTANAQGAAVDADDYLVFNTSNGRLTYDADGSGSGRATTVAILTNDYELTHTEIVVI